MINRFDVAQRSPFCIFILLRLVLLQAKKKGSHILGIISTQDIPTHKKINNTFQIHDEQVSQIANQQTQNKTCSFQH